MRLHPLQPTASVVGGSDDPEKLLGAVMALSRQPLEADSFDVFWEGDAGRVMVRYAGSTAADRARATKLSLEGVEVIEDDAPLWAAQRARQRGSIVLKVSGRPSDLPAVIRAAGGGSVVSRGALGLSWIAVEDVAAARQALAPRACTVLDGADRVGEQWPQAGGAQVVMERLKARFDPARIFRPGSFVGGI